ncbi:MAG TPA: chromosome segregation protein SMC [Bacillota bacterium]|nr:chromosome segregation protein SMC [Bacillota bacterium]
MYLKRLESRGFKSFAERINIDFVRGVTAVVGPNGSGKSNITDAIRWVLGEQSARSLRGSKMEDIIFQGSDTRGALNVAEVVLVLDNKSNLLPVDYEEVSITRRVFRSGVSEFYINKQPCRLKDIIDLFMDSGLGREAFSIISQGRVEEILSSKAEERRVIFEEAAGVLKYKQRKRKAEFKLIETEENMNRVNDIVYEIEQQIDPLRDQAQIAKTYLEKKNELKEKEIATSITQIDSFYQQWQTLLKEIDNEKLAERKAGEEINELADDLKEKRKQLQQTDETIEELQDELLSATKQLEQLEGEKNVHIERTTHVQENKEKLLARKEVLTKKILDINASIERQTNDTNDIQKQRDELKQTASDLTYKLTSETDDMAEKIEHLKADYIEVLNEQAAYRNEKQSINNQLQQFQHVSDNKTKKFSTLIEEKQVLEREVKLLTEQEEEINHSFELMNEQLSESKQKRNEHIKDIQNDREKLSVGHQQIAKFRSRQELLQEMKDDFQGFYFGVKAVLQARKQKELSHIYGAVVELIDVPKQHILAIETVLGGQSQFIVTEDDASARNAIEWLKRNKKGRATFLPLQSIQPRYLQQSIKEKVENHAGFIGIASNLVAIDETYRKVVEHLMGHVIVARTLKDANEIAQLTGRRHRVVTLEGDVVNPGGTMAGGSKKQTNQSLFTRDDELKQMTLKLKDMDKRATEFAQTIAEREKELVTLDDTISELEDNLVEKQTLQQSSGLERQNAQMKLESVNTQLKTYEDEQSQSAEDEQELRRKKIKTDEKLLQLEKDSEQIEATIKQLTDEEQKIRSTADKDKDKLQAINIQLAETQERYRNERNILHDMITEKEDLNEELGSVKKEYEHILTAEKSEQTVSQYDDKITHKQEMIDQTSQTISNNRSSRLQLMQKIEDVEMELKDRERLNATYIQHIQQKEVKANRLDVTVQNLLNYLQDEYTISFERAKQLYEQVEDIDAAKEAVKALKQSIEQLGDVNVGAIEEYDRLSERYEFLGKQKEDLTTAKEDLFSIIEEMDQVMKEQFGQTFKRIKDEFSNVFKELFGGGKAELRLTDPKDLLETGIEIIAQPPGKKLQQLGLLSGGERALTAIALLFSILRVRPVPFCVLDEVEAALDEANVVRFAKYVKMHSEETQFIVITHRKGTMEEADVLYGVTMEESGVSRLVSVQLEESKQLLESRE